MTLNLLQKTVLLVFTVTIGQAAKSETYHDILKREFRTAGSEAISESDIDRPGHPDNRLCVEIDQDKPMTETFVMVNKYVRVLEGQGPLLPRSTVTKVIYSTYAGNVFNNQIFDQINTEFLSNEIKTSQIDHESKKQWTMTIRKKEPNLIFERLVFLPENKTKVQYGYCYHK